MATAVDQTAVSLNLLIVIVNFRVAELTVDCLQSLSDEISASPGVKVVVSENGSGDDSADVIRRAIDKNEWGEWCSLVVLQSNLGFTGGNNVLIDPALKADRPPNYVLLLNPDTIVRREALTSLVDFMNLHPLVGIAGSRLEDPDGTPQRSAFRFITPMGAFEDSIRLAVVSRLLRQWIVAPPVVDHPVETDWVAGASMIVRRRVFEDIGLLDEGYFTYFDDIDFCLNARKRGWSTWYVPASRVVHLVGQSSGINHVPRRLPAYVLEARRRYFLKNYGSIYAALVDLSAIFGLALHRVLTIILRRPDNQPPHMLEDLISHSVLVKGFNLFDVEPPGKRDRKPTLS